MKRAPSRALVGLASFAVGSAWAAPPLQITPDQSLPQSALSLDQRPSVASNGAELIATWTDYRAGDAGIFAAMLDGSGTLLHAERAVSIAAGNNGFPSVAYDGSGFLVAWDDGRSGVSEDIYASRIAIDGTVEDPGGIKLSGVDGGQKYVPAFACAAPTCLVVWSDRQPVTDWDIHGAQVDTSLNEINVGDLPIWPAPNGQFFPSLQAGAGQYLLVWADQLMLGSGPTGVRFSRVDASGNALDWDAGVTLEAVASQQQPPSALTYDGNVYWVAWQYDGDAGSVIHLAQVAPDAGVTLLSPPALPMPSGSTRRPALAFDGLRVWLVYESDAPDAGLIGGQRYELDGGGAEAPRVLSVPGLIAGFPALGSDGHGRTLLWYAGSLAGVTNAHYRVLDESGSSSDAGPDAGGPGSDAGTTADAGPVDGGPPDAGPADAGSPSAGSYAVGCGCNVAPGAGLALLAALALARRRRR